MKKLLYILFYITLISCNSKTEEIKEEEVIVFSDNETTIYESDIYEVINALFEDEKENNFSSKEKFLTIYPNSNFIHPNDFIEFEIISQEDKDFIFKQVNDLKDHDLKQDWFSDFTIIPMNEKEDTQSKTDEFYYLTIPLFSKDKKTSIVVCGNISRLNGYGKILIYHKNDNQWIRSEKFKVWVNM